MLTWPLDYHNIKNIVTQSGSYSEAVLRLLEKAGYADFDRLTCVTRISGRLKIESWLHVGAGRAAASITSRVDLVVVRSRDLPIIPGSTLKGVLRTLAETYAAVRTVNVSNVSVAMLEPSLSINLGEMRVELRCTAEGLPRVESTLRSRWGDVKILIQGSAGDAVRLVNGCLCSPVVGLFGSPWLRSHIELRTAYPIDSRKAATRVVSRVSIDRFTGAQAPGRLFQVEVVEAGTDYKFEMMLVNVDPLNTSDARAEILAFLLHKLVEGVAFGGMRSVGYGVAKLESGEVSIHNLVQNSVTRMSLSDYLNQVQNILPKSTLI